MSQFLYRLGRSAAVHPYRTIGAWVLLAAVVFAWQGAAGGDPINDYRVPGVESQHASDTLTEQFPEFGGASGRVVFHVDEGRIDEERRLLYVALTRAEDTLLLSGHHWGTTENKPRGPSEFLHELKEVIEQSAAAGDRAAGILRAEGLDVEAIRIDTQDRRSFDAAHDRAAPDRVEADRPALLSHDGRGHAEVG